MTVGCPVTIAGASPGDPAVATTFRGYLDDIIRRYQGLSTPLSPAELDAAVAEFDEVLAVVLVAWRGGRAVGCAGLREVGDGVGEVTRMWVDSACRRDGIGRRLLAGVEDAARSRGLSALRLDTRHDLWEARAMYAALGREEADAFSEGPYAEHWFVRRLP